MSVYSVPLECISVSLRKLQEAGVMAQQIRAVSTIPEDPTLVPSTNVVAHTVLNSSSLRPDTLFWLCGHTYTQAKLKNT